MTKRIVCITGTAQINYICLRHANIGLKYTPFLFSNPGGRPAIPKKIIMGFLKKTL
jgi:hypothetical protein